ncbi:outer dense fiber protein 4 [Enhydra lutris kenyoni]|uniref:Outer dense fiber protein 4 n=1 Tax=Enhydra lutris kenyoni TaxID=391180 RepID=A0A2Y9L1Q1_ENHLU|nr:outer dense fiber protein 4 [Enhydra lutris kenyoni]
MSSLRQEKKGMNIGNLEGKGAAEKQDGVEESGEQEARGRNSFSEPSGSRQGLKDKHSEPRRVSVLPLWWRSTHSSRWIAQVLASELSLVAFALLLVMVFSKKWLDPSRSRFYQRWPTNVSAGIYTATHVMSMGLLHICRSNGCFHSENWKDRYKLWINHPIFGAAVITFCLTLVLGFLFTIWLHLPYIPGLQRLPCFSWVGTIMSFFEVFLIFFTMMLFPINLWIFELKKNLSIPIGWSYFIGWLVFVLYVTCAALCYFNHKHFWRVILNRPSGTVLCSNFSSPKQNLEMKPVVSHSSGDQRDVRDPERKEASL